MTDTTPAPFAEVVLKDEGIKVALSRKPRGKDLEAAYLVLSNRTPTGMSVSMALAAHVATFDGKRQPYEMLGDLLSADDAWELHIFMQTGYGKKDKTIAPLDQSSPSSN